MSLHYVVANVLNCEIVGMDFELQAPYNIPLSDSYHWEKYESSNTTAMVLTVSLLFFKKGWNSD